MLSFDRVLRNREMGEGGESRVRKMFSSGSSHLNMSVCWGTGAVNCIERSVADACISLGRQDLISIDAQSVIKSIKYTEIVKQEKYLKSL